MELILAPNLPLQRPGLLALLTARPLSAGVDMTSAVKYHDDAGIGRAVASVGLVPDFVDAAVIDTTRDALWGGDTERAPPLVIVDCEPSPALGFVGQRRNALTPPGPGGARFMVRTRATGRDGAYNCDGRSC